MEHRWTQINNRRYEHFNSPKTTLKESKQQLETDLAIENVLCPFQLPWISPFFVPHVATSAAMLIQISTVGSLTSSTSSWSLQLDLPTVASVGDLDGDFMGILQFYGIHFGFTMESNPNIGFQSC